MNGKKRGRILFTVLSLTAMAALTYPVMAQQQKKDSILAVFRKIQRTYQTAGTLSCRLKYIYATESAPSVHLDSVAGTMTVSGNNYRLVLDNTETIRTSHYTVLLFKEDKIMYITRPAATVNSPGQNPSPLSLLDSMLTSNQSLSWNIQLKKNTEIISTVFPEGMSYKKVDFTMDTLTGYVSRMSYLVRTEQLMDPTLPENIARQKAPDKYAIVESVFYDYSKVPGTADFEDQAFFTRKGNEFTPTDSYKDYKIFTGSPNL